MSVNIQNEVEVLLSLKIILLFKLAIIKQDAMLVRNAVILLENEKVFFLMLL
jgi:hypothetical protein